MFVYTILICINTFYLNNRLKKHCNDLPAVDITRTLESIAKLTKNLLTRNIYATKRVGVSIFYLLFLGTINIWVLTAFYSLTS